MFTPNCPLRAFFETTYTNSKLLARKPATVEQHQIAMDHFSNYLHWRYGRRVEPMLKHLTDEHMESLAGYLIKEEMLRPATVNKTRRHLVAQWKLAIKKRRLKPIVPTFDDLPEEEKLPQAWTPEEVGKLLWAARQLTGNVRRTNVPKCSFWPALILFLYDTGARITATMNLEKQAVNLESRTVRIPADVQKQKKEQLLDLSEQTCEHLEMLMHFPCCWLFPWLCDRGPKSTLTALRRNFRTKIVLPAGLSCERKTFHRLRATTATLAEDVEEGAGTKLLGHSDRKITEKSYIDRSRMKSRVRVVEHFPRPVLPPESKPSLKVYQPAG